MTLDEYLKGNKLVNKGAIFDKIMQVIYERK
jgi:hypothetical protein